MVTDDHRKTRKTLFPGTYKSNTVINAKIKFLSQDNIIYNFMNPNLIMLEYKIIISYISKSEI